MVVEHDIIDFGGPEWPQKYDQHSNDHETESGKSVADNIFFTAVP